MSKLKCSDEFMESVSKHCEEQTHQDSNQERFYHKSTISNIGRNVHYGKLTLENSPEELMKKEMESILEMDKEAVIDQIIKFKTDPYDSISYLLGHKVNPQIMKFLEFQSNISGIIEPSPYKPIFLTTEDYIIVVSPPIKRNVWVTVDKFPYIDCCSSFPLTGMNRNSRLYDCEKLCGCLTFDNFVKELKSSNSWYSLSFSVKIKPEDLQFYKNIVYPWDYEDSEEIHRREIKIEGEIVNDFYSKSRRNNRKRCKVVQK